MSIDVAEKLTVINPYLMGAITVAILGACFVLGRVILWLVKYILTKHEEKNAEIVKELKETKAENSSIISELKGAIDNLSETQQRSSGQLQVAIHEMSMTTQLMATTLREEVAAKTGKLHERIDMTKNELNLRIDEVHDRVSTGNEERASLAADIAKIKGRCDDRAAMCPHVHGGQHCHPELCSPEPA